MLQHLHAEFVEAVGAGAVVSDPVALRSYECDGLTGFRVVPSLVLVPATADAVAAAVRVCAKHGVPFVARGAGSGLSGGALPVADGVVISLQRLRSVVEIDVVNRRAVVEPGVTNVDISRAAAPYGLYFAPDPSSQQVCTIGGNIAENSGGAHCLKYGFTVHHVHSAEVVLPDGTTTVLGGDSPHLGGYDLLGAFIGSEGTLGIATRITVKLLAKPAAVKTLVADFPSVEQAGDTVSAVIEDGIVPAAVEMMDALAIEAVEAAVDAGYSRDAAAALVVELDGPQAEVDAQFAQVRRLCDRFGATKLRIPATAEERALVWRGRKAAFAAVGRISPNYFVQDGVVPRTQLATALTRIAELAAAAGLRVANVFHAGDGNLHPLVLYSEAAGEHEEAEALSRSIAELCVDLGGSLSGEHGIGTDKACSMPRQFSADDLATMARLRLAFDPEGISNPGKLLPTPRLCGERPGVYKPHPLEAAGLIERM
ncbi:FAD-linked oxidase C-terminal domain-containing protein [Amycolatopsis rhabdoformis]|uniref:FAD-linked oxidase C-terminal domain-containing protein n=1 Tax=Amycolatopsis rhabdoformis TaxID=1448059 RepID=A0ABZ1HY13_9PSEU|nr:FAD-linked oxidase C-terminal domain-containing protein [Amycolatopsis rhabdoformis]WSE26260.1 FAD-linked oxidase C-terminal domain-containing protein [Amycolatopsis rhabdoformis]